MLGIVTCLCFMYRLSILFLFCLLMGFANAQSPRPTNINEDSLRQVKADSINRLAADPDFIHVSLLWVSAGNKVYTASGHNALRLQCPSNNLDIAYTFEMDLSAGSIMRFFNGTAPAGYVSAPTQVFIDSYKDEGRGVKAIDLNLSPREEQNLWRFLDSEFEKGARWKFDYEHNGCSSMTVNALYQCLEPGENIDFRDFETFKASSYREVLPDLFRLSPWVHLFWNGIMGIDGEETMPFEGKLYPSVLFSESQHMVIIDSLGRERPLTVGSAKQLKPAAVTDAPFPVTPTMMFGLLCLLAVAATITECKSGYTLFSRSIDVCLMAIQTVVGIGLLYMLLFSQQVGTSWNWLIIPFNPLPFVVWLSLRKRKALYRKCCLAMAAALLVFMLCYPIVPQLHYNSLMLLCAAFLVRMASAGYFAVRINKK